MTPERNRQMWIEYGLSQTGVVRDALNEFNVTVPHARVAKQNGELHVYRPVNPGETARLCDDEQIDPEDLRFTPAIHRFRGEGRGCVECRGLLANHLIANEIPPHFIDRRVDDAP